MKYDEEALHIANEILSVLQNIEDFDDAEDYVIKELPEDYVVAKRTIEIVASTDKRIQTLAREF